MGRTYRAARRRRQRRLKLFGSPHYGYNWRRKRGRSRIHWEQGRFWLETPRNKRKEIDE